MVGPPNHGLKDKLEECNRAARLELSRAGVAEKKGN